MCNGWPIARRLRRAARLLVVPILAVAVAGCAQQRQNLFGNPTPRPRPLGPGVAASRPEPGLRVRAPLVDVQVADRQDDDTKVKASKEPTTISSRVGLFRSSSSNSSLETPRPID